MRVSTLARWAHLVLITYMRTDSTFISPEAIKDARDYIGKNIGKGISAGKAELFYV